MLAAVRKEWGEARAEGGSCVVDGELHQQGELRPVVLPVARRTSAMTPLTCSTLLVVLWCSGDPKMRVEPNARCRDVQNSAVNQQSRLDTMVSGRPTSQKTKATELRAATSDVADLKVRTSHTRLVNRLT